MSGGSFDYVQERIENHFYDLLYLIVQDLNSMAGWLEEPEQNKKEVAVEIRAYANKLNSLSQDQGILPVLKAAEW